MDASQRMMPEPGTWTWTVDSPNGFTAGRTDSQAAAIRWVYLVLSRTPEGAAVIDGPEKEESIRVSRRDGTYYDEADP